MGEEKKKKRGRTGSLRKVAGEKKTREQGWVAQTKRTFGGRSPGRNIAPRGTMAWTICNSRGKKMVRGKPEITKHRTRLQGSPEETPENIERGRRGACFVADRFPELGQTSRTGSHVTQGIWSRGPENAQKPPMSELKYCDKTHPDLHL